VNVVINEELEYCTIRLRSPGMTALVEPRWGLLLHPFHSIAIFWWIILETNSGAIFFNRPEAKNSHSPSRIYPFISVFPDTMWGNLL